MPRSLIVKGEPFSLMPDPIDSFRKRRPLHWRDTRCAGGNALDVARVERIAGEDMLDVGKHQFLVLLFMMQAKRHDGR